MNNVRLVKQGSSKSLKECSTCLSQLHQFINKSFEVYDWYTPDMKKVDIKDETKFEKEILNYYINSIKDIEKLNVGGEYISHFGNNFSLGIDKMLKKFKVRYSLGNMSNIPSSDVLMIENLDYLIENKLEPVLSLFIELINKFRPFKGSVTND